MHACSLNEFNADSLAITPQVNFQTAVSAGIGKFLKRADMNLRVRFWLTE